MTNDNDRTKEETVKCPFCGEDDFDLIGLKYYHLLCGNCEVFNETKLGEK